MRCPYCEKQFDANRGVNWRKPLNKTLSRLYCSVKCLEDDVKAFNRKRLARVCIRTGMKESTIFMQAFIWEFGELPFIGVAREYKTYLATGKFPPYVERYLKVIGG